MTPKQIRDKIIADDCSYRPDSSIRFHIDDQGALKVSIDGKEFAFILGHRIDNYDWSDMYIVEGSNPTLLDQTIERLARLSEYTGYMPELPKTVQVRTITKTPERTSEPIERPIEIALAAKVEVYESLLLRSGGRSISITG